MTTPEKPVSETIAALNDELRTTFQGGDILMTKGVAALSNATRVAVMTAIQSFDDFSEDNDPYKEHDFGAVEHEGERFFWKIDYYNKFNPDEGSYDPADPVVTNRVMTVMQASEY